MRDLYLHITGPDIKGDSTDNLNKGAIEFDSWQTGNGMAITGSRSANGNASVGRPIFSELVISKQLDSSSPYLLQNCIKGTTIDQMIIRQYRASKTERVMFLEITMTECIISSYSMSSPGEGIPSEVFSINYGKIQYKYTDTDKDTGQAANPVIQSYSLITNEKA
ncbi:MAG: type VI secretion system tube protein Hcp [Candidatus Kapabacteria bacterium]|nr:type VI secretion system tube protein Hcp [Candidatus Kapabacteria bacterium]